MVWDDGGVSFHCQGQRCAGKTIDDLGICLDSECVRLRLMSTSGDGQSFAPRCSPSGT